MRSLNIIAHPDDDLLFFNPDIIHDIVAADAVEVLYLTGGDDGLGVNELMRKLEAVGAVYHPYLIVHYHTLALRSNSHRNGDTWGDLYKMWHDPNYKTTTLFGQPADRQWVIRQLEMYVMNFRPHVIRVHNPFSDPAIDHDGPGLDHLDHIYAGKFAAEATTPFKLPTFAYMGYPVRQLEPNLTPEQIERKTNFWRAYQANEPSIQGEQWDIALSRCYKIQL